jgi:predicted kinase
MPEEETGLELDLASRVLSPSDQNISKSSQSPKCWVKPKCWIMIGIPGSGKTTFVRQILRSQPLIQIVSPDLIRAKLYNSSTVQGDWLEIWLQIELGFRTAYNSQQSVIYDATNCQLSYRVEAIALARSCGFSPITAIWLRDPLWICLMRNQNRDRQVPEEQIIAMHRSLQAESPSLLEGFDSLIYPKESKESEWMD